MKLSPSKSDPELEFLPDVVNDLDVDFSANPAAALVYMNDHRNQRKIREHSKKLQVNLIHPLRSDKRLLVLDIDYSKCFHSFSKVSESLHLPFDSYS